MALTTADPDVGAEVAGLARGGAVAGPLPWLPHAARTAEQVATRMSLFIDDSPANLSLVLLRGGVTRGSAEGSKDRRATFRRLPCSGS